jgi:hypothetical protein
MKTLVDSFSTLTIENCLLKKLPELLSPEVVMNLKDEIVSEIAEESKQSKVDRAKWNEAVTVLEDALKTLHRLDRHKPRGELRPRLFYASSRILTQTERRKRSYDQVE